MAAKGDFYLLAPGHRGCAGCGLVLVARHVLEAAGKNSIVVNATGCLEIITSPYPQSSWRVPYVHGLFENAPALASGLAAALHWQKREDINIIAMAGDGATFDIGFGLLSGLFERDDNVLYVCFDNEGYQNTGDQASEATPYGAYTMTTPAGKVSLGMNLKKKNMPAIAIAHGISYVATSTAGYVQDIINKTKKALTFKGAKYLQILCPCTPGWNYADHLTIKLGKLAQQTGLYPVFAAENGKITSVMKVPAKPPRIEEYLKPQRRFYHLFEFPGGEKILQEIQDIANQNIERYHLR